MGRAITILGFGDSVRNLIRQGRLRESCVGEVWSLNNGWNVFGDDFKADRWFALHSLEAIEKTYTCDGGHDPLSRLDLLGCDVFMQGIHHRVRRSRQYPFEAVFARFNTDFFFGSPPLMLALALYEGVSHVRTWGLDMADPRHIQQRTAWAWWVQIAATRGVTFSGTALAFMGEQEIDEGLRGLRARIRRNILEQLGPAVVSGEPQAAEPKRITTEGTEITEGGDRGKESDGREKAPAFAEATAGKQDGNSTGGQL